MNGNQIGSIDVDAAIEEGISLALALPSAILYTLECFVIVRHWKDTFGSSFYKLFLASAVNNLLFSFVGSFFFVRLTTLPQLANFFLNLPEWFSTLAFVCELYYQHFDCIITIFILAQRLTVILYPFDNERIWKYVFPVSILLTAGIPLIIVKQWFTHVIHYTVYPSDGSIHFENIHTDPANPLPSNSFLLFCSNSIAMAICLLINFAIIVAFKRETKKMGDQALASRGIENRLLVYVIVIFVAQLLFSLYNMSVYLTTFAPDIRVRLMNQFVLVTDIRSLLIPSWMLLWASSDVREKLWELVELAVFRKKSNSVSKTPVQHLKAVKNAWK